MAPGEATQSGGGGVKSALRRTSWLLFLPPLLLRRWQTIFLSAIVRRNGGSIRALTGVQCSKALTKGPLPTDPLGSGPMSSSWRDSVRTVTFQRSPSSRHLDSGRLGFERIVRGSGRGDRILAANHVSFRDLDLDAVLQVLESHRTLRLSVASPSRHSGYAWLTRDGRPTSPPASWGAPVHKVRL
ncbi:hypothetical protein MTO96_038827 [Rhipicephalus appendiculatus]